MPLDLAITTIDTKRAKVTYADKTETCCSTATDKKVWNKNGQVIQGADDLIDDATLFTLDSLYLFQEI